MLPHTHKRIHTPCTWFRIAVSCTYPSLRTPQVHRVPQELTASKRRITDPGTRRKTLPGFNQRRMARPGRREAEFSGGGLGVEQDKRCQKRPKKVILESVRRAGRDVVAGVYMVFAGVCWCLSGLWVYRFVSTKMESISAVPLMGTSLCISPLDGISLSFRRITRRGGKRPVVKLCSPYPRLLSF